MKTYGDGGIVPPFIILSIDEGEWSTASIGRFTPGEDSPVPVG
jgi:hypothetical protein